MTPAAHASSRFKETQMFASKCQVRFEMFSNKHVKFDYPSASLVNLAIFNATVGLPTKS